MAQSKGPEAEIASTSKLSNAVIDAQVLLAYAAQTGIDIQDKVVKTIVETSTLVRDNKVSDAQESAFWTALNSIAKSVRPVSISSLRATMDSHRKGPDRIFGIDIGRSSPARWAVRSYTTGIIGVLFILLSVQIYWLFGNSIISDIQSGKKKIVELETQIQTYRDSVYTKQRPVSLKVVSLNDAPGKYPIGDAKLNAMFQQLEGYQLKQQTSYHLLERWTSFFSRLLLWGDSRADSVVEQICEGTTDGFAETCRNVSRTQSVSVVLEILQRIVLPLLYGLLGSCVYVLRTLSKEITTRTFSEASIIGFRIRICLGTLGGMVVAWFVTPDVADGLFKSLSPFALAFLAGYSIELVFAAMDRFLAAFTTKTQEAK